MSNSKPHNPPLAEGTGSAAPSDAATERKMLVPLWIKIFGWIFMVLGIASFVLPMAAPVLDKPAAYEIFGLHHQGAPFDPMALAISAIILSLAASAYGLLFGKSWGLAACMVTGYGGVAICLGTMAHSVASQGTLTIRLELLLQVPYLVKLHKIKPLWISGARAHREA